LARETIAPPPTFMFVNRKAVPTILRADTDEQMKYLKYMDFLLANLACGTVSSARLRLDATI